MTAAHGGRPAGHTFRHSALLVDTDQELVHVLAPALRKGTNTYDEVLLVVSDHTRALLTESVDELTDVLRPAEPSAFYQRLGLAYEAFRRYLADCANAGRRVHVIAEPELADGVDAALRRGRLDAYLSYEAICNETYAPYGSAVTCVWDSRRHPEEVLDGVRATHPYLITARGTQRSPRYRSADEFITDQRHLSVPPAPPQVDQDEALTEITELRGLRSRLATWASGHGFADEAVQDLVVAVVEVVSNALRHAGTPVRVRAWRHGSTLITQCDDSAGLPVPATAGLRPPATTTGPVPGGRGLWLARQLADVVLIDTVPGRTSVRMHFPYAVMHA